MIQRNKSSGLSMISAPISPRHSNWTDTGLNPAAFFLFSYPAGRRYLFIDGVLRMCCFQKTISQPSLFREFRSVRTSNWTRFLRNPMLWNGKAARPIRYGPDGATVSVKSPPINGDGFGTKRKRIEFYRFKSKTNIRPVKPFLKVSVTDMKASKSHCKTSDQVRRQGAGQRNSAAYMVVCEHIEEVCNAAIGPQMGF